MNRLIFGAIAFGVASIVSGCLSTCQNTVKCVLLQVGTNTLHNVAHKRYLRFDGDAFLYGFDGCEQPELRAKHKECRGDDGCLFSDLDSSRKDDLYSLKMKYVRGAIVELGKMDSVAFPKIEFSVAEDVNR